MSKQVVTKYSLFLTWGSMVRRWILSLKNQYWLENMTACIVMPAYNAEFTLEKTYKDIPASFRDNVIVVDDFSSDRTSQIAKELNVTLIQHGQNLGYGGNQKTCYKAALLTDAEVIILLHPDYQYDSRLVEIFYGLIQLGVCDIVIGNRIRSRREAIDGGMPIWKYIVNRISTFIENFLLGQSLGDFHSGFRAYSRAVLEAVPFEMNSNSFAFDQEFLIQSVTMGFKIGDIPVPVRYFEEASSIGLKDSLIYGIRTMIALLKYFLHKSQIFQFPMFYPSSRTVH